MRQYLKFLINGGILGIVSWALQAFIFWAMESDSGSAYAVATALTYLPLVLINFLVQRSWIFRRDGIFFRFAAANVLIMFLVSGLSPLCRMFIASMAGAEWGDRGGFIMAALLGSVPSFIIQRSWVFTARSVTPS